MSNQRGALDQLQRPEFRKSLRRAFDITPDRLEIGSIVVYEAQSSDELRTIN
jgi:hypothetical protein